MTRCAYYQLRIEHCLRKASEMMALGDENLKQFFINARLGFQKRLARMTVEELESEC